jgi:DNA-binding FrmR family transcriptional regulator
MTTDCRAAVNHISRLQGQLESLKRKIESESSCEEIVPLALSAAKSFDGLRAKIVQGFVSEMCFSDKDMTAAEKAQFDQLLKLIKS